MSRKTKKRDRAFGIVKALNKLGYEVIQYDVDLEKIVNYEPTIKIELVHKLKLDK